MYVRPAINTALVKGDGTIEALRHVPDQTLAWVDVAWVDVAALHLSSVSSLS